MASKKKRLAIHHAKALVADTSPGSYVKWVDDPREVIILAIVGHWAMVRRSNFPKAMPYVASIEEIEEGTTITVTIPTNP